MSVTAIAARVRPRRCSFSAPSPPSSPSASSLCTSPADLAQALTVTDHPPQLRSVQKVVASSGLENGRAFLESSSHPPYRSLCSRLAPAGALDLAAVDQTVSNLQALPLRGPSSATCATTSADGDRQPSFADGDRRPSSCVVAQCDDQINGRKCSVVAPSEEEGWRVKTARPTMDARLGVVPAQPPLLSSSIKQVVRATCPPLGGGNQVRDHLVEEGGYVDQSADMKYLDRADGFALGNQPIGSIHVIVGPMFAGKTTALLKRLEEEASNGRRVVLVKSAKDNRYATSAVVTHDGWRMECFAMSSLSQFCSRIGEEAYNQVEVIGIDEAQFFEDLESFCCHAAERDGKTVIAAGLDGDFRRRKFGSIIDLVPIADSISKLAARCESCGRPAHFTLRKSNDARTELIGGSDLYTPVCRRHYLAAHRTHVASVPTVDSRIRQSC